MAWPIEGEAGWEEFGEPIDSLPIRYELPQPVKSYYYDPSRLNGLGLAQEALTLLFNESTVTVRRRVATVEAEFIQTLVWGDALLDRFVVPDLGEPCSLVLEIFADDRETVLWAVGTSPNHPYPYLEEPDSYAEQEIDVAAGAATLGTVSYSIIDKARTAGDQDSGWVTQQLASLGIANLAGRRARMKRFTSIDVFYVIADGPAGTPRLNEYAAFSGDIRDTRETERKFPIFTGGWGGDRTNPIGARTLLPDGIWGGYGFDGTTYLIDPATPLLGRAQIGTHPLATQQYMRVVDLQSVPGNSAAQRTISLASFYAAEGRAEYTGEVTVVGSDYERRYLVTFENLTLLWRAVGDTVWKEISETLRMDLLQIDIGAMGVENPVLNMLEGGPSAGSYAVANIIFGDSRGDAFLPDDDEDIELVLYYRGQPSEALPAYVEGITAGQFAVNVYAGLYSARDQDGNQVPTGIRYVEADILQITNPVRIRITEPIKDARDWLEKHIYAPTGWVPALNDLGEISPVSQIAPLNGYGLLAITNPITEPSPDWNAGERIINTIRFKYFRDYLPPDEEPSPLNQEWVRPEGNFLEGARAWLRTRRQTETAVANPDGDGLAKREIIVEFVNVDSVERYGEQLLEIDALAFRAIGQPTAEPLGDDIELEPSHTMAVARNLHLANRFNYGAPAISVAVMRSATMNLRAGSWVVLDLSWLPDYVTRRRGLIGLAQIVSLGDLDCMWRQALVEVVVPISDGYDY